MMLWSTMLRLIHASWASISPRSPLTTLPTHPQVPALRVTTTAKAAFSASSDMVGIDTTALMAACAAYPKPADFHPSYGTAGFRAEASLLPSTVFRCGLLIGLRAKATGQVGSFSCALLEFSALLSTPAA